MSNNAPLLTLGWYPFKMYNFAPKWSSYQYLTGANWVNFST